MRKIGCTFDGRIEELERVCRRTPGVRANGEQPRPEYGSRARYAEDSLVGIAAADAKLVERFKLLKSGQVLSLVSTWTDPKVLRTPQTYEYRYNRMTRDHEGRLGSGCDPYDDERAAFLLGRPGAVR